MKKAKSFTQKELLDLANEVYDDGFLAFYYNKKGELKRATGDTLAKFIVIELIETFDPKQSKKRQLWTAMAAMESAKYQLADVHEKLEDAYAAL